MLKLTYTLLHNTRVCNRPSISMVVMKFKEYSTTQTVEVKKLKSEDGVATPTQELENLNDSFKSKSRIVAAAFASLKHSTDNTTEIKTPYTDLKVANATSVDELLSVTEGEGISRRLALKIVSVLADWTTNKKIKLSDFENDFRFVKLCRVLTKDSIKPARYTISKSEDLSTVLSVTADDEAAKLVGTITLPQMVKVMTTLSNKKRRSTLLLRTLAYNISGSPEKLNLKLCADLLYSMAVLNFIDDNLLSRIALDISLELETDVISKTSAVIGSIFTSLGLLKYKNPVVLDLMMLWIMKNHNICRSQDIFSMFFTLATLNYLPQQLENCFKVVNPILTKEEAIKPAIWLDYIWSKTILNIATPSDVSDVLSENFLNSLSKSGAMNKISTKLRILNIYGARECLIKECKGSILPVMLDGVAVPKRKEKIEISEAIVTALKNLMQADKYFRSNIDTGYGFYIDAECVLDDKCNPIDFTSKGNRIAILSLDYHDMTRGYVEPTGINIFAKRVLEGKGYKVLVLPHKEFNSKDKLVSRVQYLERKLKELVKNV